MCRLGLALSPLVVFHQSVNSFQSALGAPVRGKLDLTEQRQTLFLEPVSTSLPNRARTIPEMVMENIKRCFKSLLKNHFQFKTVLLKKC